MLLNINIQIIKTHYDLHSKVSEITLLIKYVLHEQHV